jgi:hypothetical protein
MSSQLTGEQRRLVELNYACGAMRPQPAGLTSNEPSVACPGGGPSGRAIWPFETAF